MAYIMSIHKICSRKSYKSVASVARYTIVHYMQKLEFSV